MSILLFFIGILLPACFGWVLVRTAEAGSPLLHRSERCLYGLILGPTAMTLLTLLFERLGLLRFDLLGFLLPMTGCIAVLLGVLFLKGWLTNPHLQPWTDVPRSKTTNMLLIVVLVWVAVKLLAGAYDVFTVPTYWDDSFNNWNLRGKIFYETKTFTLAIQNGNGIVQDAQGVSSYPPALPLLKTWMSVLQGRWIDGVVNGVHLLWIVGLLGAVFFTLRRRSSLATSVLGTAAVTSMPLVLLHSYNPYAEIFLASHLFLAVATILEIAEAKNATVLATRFRLLGLCIGLLLFTKNEATVLYAPILMLVMAYASWKQWNTSTVSHTEILHGIGTFSLLAAVLTLPWIIYKWTHGLTFGNAKAVSGFTFSFNKIAFDSILYQLTHEPNFLLLPFIIPFLLIVGRKKAFTDSWLVLTGFILIALTLQIGVFVCVPSLANEAILQTGLNRGMVHIAPIAILLVTLLADRLLKEAA